MFLIFGLRTKAYPMGWVDAACQACGYAGRALLVRESTKLSLFFIPLIPIRTKYVVECQSPVCRSRTRVTKSEANRLLAGSPVGH